MGTFTAWRDPILINTVGHAAGVLAFGVIVALLIRDSRGRGMRQSRLPLLAAILALSWNSGSLLALGASNRDSFAMALVMTASFAVLSFLPAVLLHVVLERRNKAIIVAGYVVSVGAVVLHFSELAVQSIVVHQAALILIAIGFCVLSVAAFLSKRSTQRKLASEALDGIRLAALLLFCLSFLHFGYEHTDSPWSAEVAWHHIGIPAVLVILLQDYRFLLLDAFVRFLINFGVAALYVFAVVSAMEKFGLWYVIRTSSFLAGISLVVLCLSLVLFAYLRNVLQGWVSQVIFRRSNVEASIGRIEALGLSVRSEEELLARAAGEVSRYLRAAQFAVASENPGDVGESNEPSLFFNEDPQVRLPVRRFRPEAQIPLHFSSGDSCFLLAGMRRGGRRYLSEDMEAMRRLGAAIVGQVERYRAEELRRLATQAELRALQAQINPHFLFNSLNTLYGTIDRQSHAARRLVLNLAELLRYLLQSNRVMVQLSEEMRIVQAYLEIESFRLGDRLETSLLVTETAKSVMIPVLSIQPLVENAVKHGIEMISGRGCIRVIAEDSDEGIRVTVSDTGLGFARSENSLRNGNGIGLENVKRRLMLCYGSIAVPDIQTSDAGTTVTFLVPKISPTEILQKEHSEDHDPVHL